MAPDEFTPDLDLIQRIKERAEFKAPDLIGTVEGWRAWGVPVDTPRFGAPPKLYSVTHSQYYWTPRKHGVAQCLLRGGHDLCKGIAPPREDCSCGFYSAKTLEHLKSMTYHLYDAERNGLFHIVGQVANWGKVVEGSQGWRSQYAYPVKLWVPFEAYYLAEELGETYGVPVALKNTLKAPDRKEPDAWLD